MKFKNLYFLFILFLFNSTALCITSAGRTTIGAQHKASLNTPPETFILKLQDTASHPEWKEVTRNVSKHYGDVQFAPITAALSKTLEPTSLISIQFFDVDMFGNVGAYSLNEIFNSIKHDSYKEFGRINVTYRVLEKTDSEIIYEYIRQSAGLNAPVQHSIFKGILTKHGFNLISLDRRYGEIESKEKIRWIKNFKESAEIVPFTEASKSTSGLSLANKFKYSVDLGAKFKDWSQFGEHEEFFGYNLILYIPPSQKESSPITEWIEVGTMRTLTNHVYSLDEVLDIEKQKIQYRDKKSPELNVLEQSATEVIYTRCQTEDDLQLNVVSRIIFTEKGFYSIAYHLGANEKIKDDDIARVKDSLKSVLIRSESI